MSVLQTEDVMTRLRMYLRETGIFDELVDTLLPGFWTMDGPETTSLRVAPGLLRMLGFDPGLQTGLTWQDLVWPEDRARADRLFEGHANAPGASFEQVLRFSDAKGAPVSLHCRGFAAGPNPAGWRLLGTLSPVLETRTQERDRKLSDGIRSSGEAILVWTPEDGIRSWNKGAEILFGVEDQAARGQDPVTLTGADFGTPFAAVLDQLAEMGNWEGAVTHKNADGHGFVSWSRISSLTGAQGDTQYIMICRNDTERQNALVSHPLVIGELKHRTLNTFAMIQSVIGLASRRADDVDSLGADLQSRFASLAAAEGLVLDTRVDGYVTLHAIVREIVRPPIMSEARLVLSGSNILLPARSISALAMILHEFTAAAGRNNAWTRSEPAVRVSWSLSDDATVSLTWQERAPSVDPHAQPPGPGLQSVSDVMLQSSIGQLGGHIETSRDDLHLTHMVQFPVPKSD